MNKNKILLNAAMAGLILATTGCSTLFKTQSSSIGHCQGANSCKGQGDCGGKSHGCSGMNQCKGKGWVKATESECIEMKGKFES